MKAGDNITVLPSGVKSSIKAIYDCDKEIASAETPDSVTITLNDNIDISRGDMVVKSDDKDQPNVGQDLSMMICWLGERPMQVGAKYAIRQSTNEVKGIVKAIDYKVNISTLGHEIGATTLSMNDIAQITIKTAKPIVFDSYSDNRTTGSLVFVDEATNETVGAAMIL